MRTFLNHIKNETLCEIKTSLENLWQRMIQLSEFFQYSFVLILKRKCLVRASRVRCGESGTPSTIMEPTTDGSLWLENDLHENELEFESHMGRSKKNVRVTSDGIHAEIHEIWTCVAPAAPPLFHAAVNPCLQGESPWNWTCNSVNLRKGAVTWMRRHYVLQ